MSESENPHTFDRRPPIVEARRALSFFCEKRARFTSARPRFMRNLLFCSFINNNSKKLLLILSRPIIGLKDDAAAFY